MRAHLNAVKSTIIFAHAVIGALLDRTFNTVICFAAIHKKFLLIFAFYIQGRNAYVGFSLPAQTYFMSAEKQLLNVYKFAKI